MAAELTPTDIAIFGSADGSIDLQGMADRSERGSPPRARQRLRGDALVAIPPDIPGGGGGGPPLDDLMDVVPPTPGN
jgi:hypothetical protein